MHEERPHDGGGTAVPQQIGRFLAAAHEKQTSRREDRPLHERRGGDERERGTRDQEKSAPSVDEHRGEQAHHPVGERDRQRGRAARDTEQPAGLPVFRQRRKAEPEDDAERSERIGVWNREPEYRRRAGGGYQREQQRFGRTAAHEPQQRVEQRRPHRGDAGVKQLHRRQRRGDVRQRVHDRVSQQGKQRVHFGAVVIRSRIGFIGEQAGRIAVEPHVGEVEFVDGGMHLTVGQPCCNAGADQQDEGDA